MLYRVHHAKQIVTRLSQLCDNVMTALIDILSELDCIRIYAYFLYAMLSMPHKLLVIIHLMNWPHLLEHLDWELYVHTCTHNNNYWSHYIIYCSTTLTVGELMLVLSGCFQVVITLIHTH